MMSQENKHLGGTPQNYNCLLYESYSLVFPTFKGSPETSHNRCFYTEHALKSECRVTYYYQVLRVYYTKRRQEVNAIVRLPVQVGEITTCEFRVDR